MKISPFSISFSFRDCYLILLLPSLSFPTYPYPLSFKFVTSFLINYHMHICIYAYIYFLKHILLGQYNVTWFVFDLRQQIGILFPRKEHLLPA